MSGETNGGTVPIGVYQDAMKDLHRYKAQVRKLKEADAATAGRIAELEGAVTSLTAERDEARGKLGAPDEKDRRIAELEGSIRARAHRDAFDEAAKGFKSEKGEAIDEAALEALWKLSGYQAEGDSPDEAKLTETITAAVAAHPFVLRTPAPGGANGEGPTPTPGPAGPGLSRGAPENGGTRTTLEQQIDAEYQRFGGALRIG